LLKLNVISGNKKLKTDDNILFGFYILIIYIKPSAKHVFGFAKVIESLLYKRTMF